ncbi:hypothetical protein K438DRAFT_1964448 [Mycena galopus ATCC 62051]|nr:hypothetical protein K438DRAFT_1964448 [Mycena galopus ATCC 62051]
MRVRTLRWRYMYHNAAKISGEVRMVPDALANLGSIDAWAVSRSSFLWTSLKLPMAAMTVNAWNRKKGGPRSALPAERPFTGKFPAGAFVLPFELPALPEDTLVKHPDGTQRKNMARVPLPRATYCMSKPSVYWGIVKYIARINVARGGLDDEFGMPFQYVSLCRPLPRAKMPFPYIPTREDWPFAREVVGGWMLTLFGGRGRLGDELVEVEGILGIQDRAIYTAWKTLEFALLLWSANPRALEALGLPGAVKVEFVEADVISANALAPRAASRRDRYTCTLA